MKIHKHYKGFIIRRLKDNSGECAAYIAEDEQERNM
jgi:hypothetical protein